MSEESTGESEMEIGDTAAASFAAKEGPASKLEPY
jgi:hypothetical protein